MHRLAGPCSRVRRTSAGLRRSALQAPPMQTRSANRLPKRRPRWAQPVAPPVRRYFTRQGQESQQSKRQPGRYACRTCSITRIDHTRRGVKTVAVACSSRTRCSSGATTLESGERPLWHGAFQGVRHTACGTHSHAEIRAELDCGQPGGSGLRCCSIRGWPPRMRLLTSPLVLRGEGSRCDQVGC